MPQKKFTEALSLYHPADAEIRKLISSAQVANMALNRESRALSLTVFFQDILSCELLSKIKDGIKSAYQLSSVEIFPKYPKSFSIYHV